jgi:hypothetical protein
MPGSRLPGLPAQFLGPGDGHSCVLFRSLNERFLTPHFARVVPGVDVVRPRLRLLALHVDPAPWWRALRPRNPDDHRSGLWPEERCPLRGRDVDNQGSVRDAVLRVLRSARPEQNERTYPQHLVRGPVAPKDQFAGVSRLRATAPIRTVVVVRPLAQPREDAFVGSADDAFVARVVSSLDDARGPRAADSSPGDLARQAVAASRESVESPHCIALQVATVRYIEPIKPPLTCDNAEKTWSDEDRYLLCKQGVAVRVRSSPP